ncbi:L-threonylcarbamoyladenylate synthase [Actinomyces slackii]|uniref:L-threonylcarbamoyladenylate synthase n=1 Tax=Actinomyces slackii TaxID=52774 RepID=A0A448KC72_9ACTO|nr:t(6)A37 threonylcarbamoyladenosine biosynthesis protein RimN [Actinomyces slackii]
MSPSLEPTDRPASGTVERAARHLREGGLVILPTDTVYGIGCAAGDGGAVSRLLAAKGRGRQMPPPILVSSPEDLQGLAQCPAGAQDLIEAFWPGPLTLVLDADGRLDWDLGETGGTIAVRMPNHPLALELLARSGPAAVTSANLSGQPPATTADQAERAFAGRARRLNDPGGAGEPQIQLEPDSIALLDAGPTPGPVPSTIVDLSSRAAEEGTILRRGALEESRIRAVLAGHAPAAGSSPAVAAAPAGGGA